MPAINSSAPPRNLSSAPSGISTKSPIGGTLNNTYYYYYIHSVVGVDRKMQHFRG